MYNVRLKVIAKILKHFRISKIHKSEDYNGLTSIIYDIILSPGQAFRIKMYTYLYHFYYVLGGLRVSVREDQQGKNLLCINQGK